MEKLKLKEFGTLIFKFKSLLKAIGISFSFVISTAKPVKEAWSNQNNMIIKFEIIWLKEVFTLVRLESPSKWRNAIPSRTDNLVTPVSSYGARNKKYGQPVFVIP